MSTPKHKSKKLQQFSAAYDRYAPLLNGILFEFTSSKKDAESILAETFETAYHQDIFETHKHCLLPHLIKLSVKISKKYCAGKTHPKPCFERLPMLHHFLFENGCVQQHATKFNISPLDIGKIIRSEISTAN